MRDLHIPMNPGIRSNGIEVLNFAHTAGLMYSTVSGLISVHKGVASGLFFMIQQHHIIYVSRFHLDTGGLKSYQPAFHQYMHEDLSGVPILNNT